MEIELIAEIKIDGGGRFSQNFEGSPARHNREVGLKALNQLYGYSDGKIPLEITGHDMHSEATSTFIRGTSFRVKATLNKDGTLTIK